MNYRTILAVVLLAMPQTAFGASPEEELRAALKNEDEVARAAQTKAAAAAEAQAKLEELKRQADEAAALQNAAEFKTDSAVANALKARPEAQKNAAAEAATYGNSGVSIDPQWDLLAAAAITTVDADQPLLDLGAQYNSVTTLLRVMLRRNLNDDAISGSAGDAKFGHATLNPALGAFSASFRLERIFVWNPKLLYGRFARFSPRYYLNVDASRAKFNVSYTDEDGGAQTLSKTAVPTALSLGLAFKMDGTMPGDASFAGSKLLVIEPYVGPALRMLGGDLNSSQRTQLWQKSNDARYFFGLELGAIFQFGGIMVDPKVTWLGPVGDDANFVHNRVNGLTGIQFDMTVAYVLPWTVVGGEKKPAHVAEEEAAAADSKAKEKRQDLIESVRR